ncbi:M48 family metallopeptidase [Paracoccus sediminilitoris]|uniref:M48 family metallopeptidase n=1 Tax=Paracoccus sediminilitoris TaxID=2202419 RepID=UPI002279C618|nr:YgjP-like metallopeptidase domain-containing protein [Paracoccus sediminilitoris]
MMRELHCLQYGEQEIRYEIVRRPRKTLEIAVEPDASVVIAALEDATLDAIEAKLRKRAAWVTRQQRYFAQFLPRTPERRFVACETHLYLRRQYRLKVVPHVQECVKLIRGFIVVQTHRPTRPEVTRELVEAWYRDRHTSSFRSGSSSVSATSRIRRHSGRKVSSYARPGSDGGPCRRPDACS